MIEVAAQTRGGSLNELVQIEIGRDRVVDFEQHLRAHALLVCLLVVETIPHRDRDLVAHVSEQFEILFAEIVRPRAAEARNAELLSMRADERQTSRLRTLLDLKTRVTI